MCKVPGHTFTTRTQLEGWQLNMDCQLWDWKFREILGWSTWRIEFGAFFGGGGECTFFLHEVCGFKSQLFWCVNLNLVM